jgi:hypothetical protein
MIEKPNQAFVPINISVTTVMTSDNDTAILIHENICGNASGKIICLKSLNPCIPKDLAALILKVLENCTQYIVLIIKSRDAHRATRAILASLPMPNISIKSGNNAVAGMLLQKSTKNCILIYIRVEYHIPNHKGIPIHSAMQNHTHALAILAPVCIQRLPSWIICMAAYTTSPGYGKKTGLTDPVHSTAYRIPMSSITGIPQYSI